MSSTVSDASTNAWMFSSWLLLLVSSSAFAVANEDYDEYPSSGSGSGDGDDECWDGNCHPDKRFADSVDCVQCPEVGKVVRCHQSNHTPFLRLVNCPHGGQRI